MEINYDPYDSSALHKCDSCKKFVTKKRFLAWQKTWMGKGDPEDREPLLCPMCG